jgi:hypothetical protein
VAENGHGTPDRIENRATQPSTLHVIPCHHFEGENIMSRRTISYLFALALIMATLVACSPTSASTTNSESQVVNTSSTTTNSNTAVSNTVSAGAGAVSVAEAVAENSASHDDAADYVWDNSTSTQIILNGSTTTTNGTGVTVTGNIATITSAGTYNRHYPG